ncbi:hypothetical protein [Xanthomonas arboricola]|uniref:hypothetical protein n=1 Tax=Xanthomonas arboricola TaxID=56448 RepID=UPI00141AA61C|nr:hypothetical protein [Xanthomonas arboricola]NIK42014.1 hypothetical protein [Xanthomonas arboricola]
MRSYSKIYARVMLITAQLPPHHDQNDVDNVLPSELRRSPNRSVARAPAMLLTSLARGGRVCAGPTVLCDDILQCIVLNRKVGINLFELAVLGLQVAKALYISDLHVAVLGLPGVLGRLENAQLVINTFDLVAAPNLFQRGDDLAFGELAFAHPYLFLGLSLPRSV